VGGTSPASTIEAAREARAAGLPLQINTTVCAETVDELPALADLVEELGAVLWSVFFLVPVGRGRELEPISPERTRRAVWISALLTVLIAALAVPVAGPVYAGVLVAGSVCFLLAYRAYAATGAGPSAVRAFFTSNVHLAVLFLGRAVDGVLAVPAWAGPVAAGVVVFAFRRTWAARPSLKGIDGAHGDLWPAVRRRVVSVARS